MAFPSLLPPTAVTIEKAVHFVTPDGEDLVIEPGTYDVTARERALTLTQEENGIPILIQAQEPPVTEENLTFPVAMAIPVEEEGIYLALEIPNQPGLEAMGSYSGIQTRGAGILSARHALTPADRQQLDAFASRLAQDPSEPSLKDEWQSFAQKEHSQVQSRGVSSVHAKLVQLSRQLALRKQQELRELAKKQRENIEKKKSSSRETTAMEPISQSNNAAVVAFSIRND